MKALEGLSVTTLLGVGTDLDPLVGGVMALVGAVYLFFGKRLFRLLIVATGAAVGFEAGRLAGLKFGMGEPLWAAVPAAAVIGALVWPLWQAGVFLMGGIAGAVITGDALSGATGDSTHHLYGVLAGFVIGGLVGVALLKAMSVFLTALIGSFLMYVGGVAVVGSVLSAVARLPEMTVVSLGLIGLLCLAGIVVQVAQGDPEENRRRRVEEADRKRKLRDEADAKERWNKYLDGG